jgi:hypothetical protein
MDSNGNEQGVTRIIKKCILEWLEIAFGIEEEEEPIPPTWEEFWALVVVWLQAEQDQDGVPLHGLLHTHKNIVKIATVVHGDPDHRSFVDMLRQEGECLRIKGLRWRWPSGILKGLGGCQRGIG